MGFSHNLLELSQILDIVSNYASSTTSKTQILNITPSSNLERTEKSLEDTAQMYEIISKFGRMPISESYDIRPTIERLKIVEALAIKDLMDIKGLLNIEASIKMFSQNIGNSYENIYGYTSTINNHNNVNKLINEIIDQDGSIFDHASDELLIIRKDIKRKQNLFDKLLDNVLVKYESYLNESLIVMRNGRYAIPVKEAYKHKVKGVIHDVSASKQTVYIEPDDLRQLSQDLEYLKEVEENEIYKILVKLTYKIKPFSDTLLFNIELFTTLDIIHAKALYAKSIDANKPLVNKKGVINLIRARHPLIDPSIVVPIDVTINDSKRTLMITGPNTGGKTVALKTVGLFTLMSQSGLLLPTSQNSEIAVFDHIFADIGDEQSIAQSLSTFSSHLTKIKKMFDEISGHSLVLLDELGSGTDPQEGVALAIAIIDELRLNKNVRLILTTHYSELKLYAYEKEDIQTASVSFDVETLRPLYKLKTGIMGSSHAISIAKRLGINEKIIQNATALLTNRQSNLAKSLEKLSIEQNELELTKDDLIIQKEILDKQIKEYQEKNLLFEKEKQLLLDKIKQKELKKYEKLKEEATELINELSKKENISKPEAASFKGKLNKGLNKEVQVNEETLEIGNTVYIHTYQQEGIITGVKPSKDLYTVLVGQFPLDFKKSDLSKVEAKPKEQKKKNKSIVITPKKHGSMELDLRGVRFEEVSYLMDKAIDNALLANLPYIRVIHGFGTGAVRKAVYDYIKQSSYIKSHRYGQEGEGLNGVTIITL